MAIQYVGGTSAQGSTTYDIDLTSLSGGIDTQPREGDVVIVSNGAVSALPGLDLNVNTAGFTRLKLVFQDESDDANIATSWKRMTSTPDTSINVDGNLSNKAGTTTVQVWRGVDATNPIDVTTTTSKGADTCNGSPAAITPVTQGAVVIISWEIGSASTKTVSTWPANYENLIERSYDSGTASTSAMASKFWSGSGAETPGAWTMSSTAVTQGFVSTTIALRPAAASGPANLKSYNTNLKANIKSINTNLIANVKSLNTNT